MSGAHLSKDFFELVKSIGESKSKQEEDRIIVREVATLKRLMGDTKVSAKRMKEFLVRILYVEMLGHDASFGYIKAVELTACGNLLQKRVGYLTAGLCFSPDHEFRLMLVNRLQKDMISSNLLEATAALMAACKLITADMIPAVLPTVVDLLKHDQEIVRKKAVMVLQRFNVMAPASVAHLGERFRRALCDKDPSVMGASLHALYDLARADPTSFKDLVPSFVSILKQITEHRLPREFDYHRIPAPWIQMRLLRILAILGNADQRASEGMYEVLLDVMRRADTGINVGYAIIYECVHTVTSIYPNSTLLDAAAAAIARFIKSDNHNLKYLGVTGLTAIVKDHPKYAAEHQLAVIDCLEDPDETLQRKTLALLYRMTNPVNVEVIVSKLLGYLKQATDVFLRMELVTRVTEAAERFAPNNNWYVSTMTEVFEIGGDLVRPEVAQNVVNLISEGTGEDDDAADESLRRHAVETYLALLDKPALPDVLLQVLFWVLGEYGYLSSSMSLDAILDRVCALAARANVDATTRGYALAAALKLTAQLGRVTPAAASVVERFADSRHADLAQRCHEFRALLERPATMADVLPVDASCEEIDLDPNLGFLDGVVQQALASGARAYVAHDESDESEDEAEGAGPGADGGLRFEAYENPEESTNLPGDGDKAGAETEATGGLDSFATGAGGGLDSAGGLGGLGGVKSVWGDTGYSGSGASASTVGDKSGGPAGSGGGAPMGGNPNRPWDGPGAGRGAPQPVEERKPPSPKPEPTRRVKTPEPPKPRELTEKEKAAAALFGGVFGGGAPASTSAPSSVASASRASSVASASTQPDPTPAAPAAAAPDDDLLGLDFGGGGGGSASADPFGSSGGGLDLMGGSPAPAGGGAGAAAAAPAAAADPLSAAFDGLVVGGSDAGSTASAPAFESLSVPPRLAAAVSGLRSSDANQLLVRDDNVAVAGHKVWTDGGVAFVVFVASSGSALSNVSVSFEPPPFLRVASVDGEPSAGASGGRVDLGSLPPGGSSACAVASTVLCAAPSNGAALRGSVAFTALGGAPTALAFSFGVDASDTLRPAPIDTATFGSSWGAHAQERKVAFASKTINTPDAFMDAAQRVLHAHGVEKLSATFEAIAAARLMGTQQLVLFHARIARAGGVELTVRSQDGGFSGNVAQVAQANMG